MMDSITVYNKKKKQINIIIAIILWLLIWQGAYMAVGEDLLLASPFSVIHRIIELASTPAFWRTIANSFLRIMGGFLLGAVTGVFLGILTAKSPALYTFFSIPMNIVKATPVASFIILALVWISGRNLSVFISFLMVLPLVWSNVDQGVRNVDIKLLEMAKVFKLSKSSTILHIYLPSVAPYFLSALRVGLGFAWKSGISGEVIAIPSGAVGTQLYDAKVYLLTEDLFAWTAVIVLLSVLIERILVWLASKLSGRRLMKND